MDVLHPCCAGLDVHKDSVYACVRQIGPGGGVGETVKVFGTMTPDLLRLTRQKAAVSNRIQKVLEDANLKLGSVASDVLGKSGRAMLRAIIAGETDPVKLAELALGRLRKQLPRLRPALTGRVTDHHRFVLKLFLDEVEMVEAWVRRLEERIEVVLSPFADAVRRWTTIPGVDRRTAQAVAAEIGTDMGRFPTEGHLSAWAGMCPGNDESAGRRRSGKTPKGSPWLKRALVQAAWAASHTKDTYLSAFYRRLAARRGRKRALVGLGHAILGIMYHMQRTDTDYADLGGDYFERRDKDRLTRRLVRRLEALGMKVTLEPTAQAA